MWLEKFGTVDQNIFFGFCAVVFLIFVLVIACMVIKHRYRRNTIIVPGHSLTSAFVLSSLLICISVLFRGVQPGWSSQSQVSMGNVCQLFVPFISLGYVIFGTSLFVKMWMIVINYRLDKITFEWVGNFVQWVFVVVTGTAVIIWIATFTPNVFPLNKNITISNITTTVLDNNIYECRGWTEDGSRDAEQFGWRVAISCVMALTVVITVSAIPFYGCLQLVPDRIRTAAKAVVISTLLSAINGVCCVIAGLIVWFQYRPQPTSDRRLNDSNKYAIIGSLQLWMLFFSVATTLIAEIVTMRVEKSADDKHPPRSFYNTQSTSTSLSSAKKNTKKLSAKRPTGSMNDGYSNEHEEITMQRKSTYNDTMRSGGSLEILNDELPDNHQHSSFDHADGPELPQHDDRTNVPALSTAASVEVMSNQNNDDNMVDYYMYQF